MNVLLTMKSLQGSSPSQPVLSVPCKDGLMTQNEILTFTCTSFVCVVNKRSQVMFPGLEAN